MTWADMYRDGMTVEEIALDASASPTTVRRHLRAEGVEMRPKGERKGVERRLGPRSGDLEGLREPDARIVRPSVSRMFR